VDDAAALPEALAEAIGANAPVVVDVATSRRITFKDVSSHLAVYPRQAALTYGR